MLTKWSFLKVLLQICMRPPLFMRRMGSRKEFTLNNYPANDTSWKFIDQKSVLIKKGYKPPIHDFSITGAEGEDLTQKSLVKSGIYSFNDLKKTSGSQQKEPC